MVFVGHNLHFLYVCTCMYSMCVCMVCDVYRCVVRCHDQWYSHGVWFKVRVQYANMQVRYCTEAALRAGEILGV